MMEAWAIMVIVVTAIGCGTGIILTFIDKVFGGKQKQAQLEARMAQERVRSLEAQLVDSHRQSEMLQKQLEWHTKMLETQDKMMKQLTDGAPAASQSRPTVGSAS
jgi:uncharacterized membrane protein (DUF106 family)